MRKSRIPQILLTLSLCLPIVFATPLRADDSKIIQAINTSGQDVSCLVAYIRGAGNDLTVDPAMIMGGPFQPNVTIAYRSGIAIVTMDWRECVIEPGTTITSLMQTSAGPLGLWRAFWCKDSGRVARVEIPSGTSGTGVGGSFFPLPPTPGGGTYKLGFESRNKGVVPPFKTPWFKGPPRFAHRSFCWWRLCCTPGYDVEYRLAFYCTPSSLGSLFGGTRICIPLSPWVPGGSVPGKYKWQFTSIKPRGKIVEWNIFGPPKDLSRALADIGMEYTRKVFVADSDSGIFAPSIDASSAFQSMSSALVPTFGLDSEPPVADSFEAMLQIHGRPYLESAEIAAQLTRRLREVLSQEPNADFHQTARSLTRIARGMETIGTCFSAGRVPPASLFYGMSRAYSSLAQQADELGDAYDLHRFGNVAGAYRQLAEQHALAADQVAAGLDTVAERDDFLWAMLIGARNSMRDAGISFEPHARVVFGLPDYEWDSNTIPAAVVQLRTEDGRVVDDFDVPVSDFNTVHLPYLGNIEPGVQYVANLKIPGCLAKSFGISMKNDGNSIRITELVSGDVDDDNCVTARDLRLTIGDEGQGGQDADAVPATDANTDGIVDELDSDVVNANLGECGDE